MGAMKTAAQIGIPVSEFWGMTPGELGIYVEVYISNKKQEREDQIVLEYMNAAWQRAKRLPNIKSILDDKPKKMTNKQMLDVIKKLNQAFGGEVVTASGSS